MGKSMKKKLLINSFIIASAFLIFATWYQNCILNKKSVSVSNQNQHYTIYLITMDKQTNFWEIMNQGATDMANLIGVNYIWAAPQKRVVEEQIQIFNQAVERGADAILLAASDPVRISSAVEDAKAKGVKIIYVDAPANEEAVVTLATENYNAGRIAGETMLSELGAAGITSGSIGIIDVMPESLNTVNRDLGFRDVLSRDGRFELLDTQYVGAEEVLLEKEVTLLINETSNLVGLFATNENTTIGTGNAIQASGKKPIGIGFDYNEQTKVLLKNNALKAVLNQNPYTMGYLGMAEAVAALKGYNTGPPFINTGVSVINQYTPYRDR